MVNKQLIAAGFRKCAEAMSLFEEAFLQDEGASDPAPAPVSEKAARAPAAKTTAKPKASPKPAPPADEAEDEAADESSEDEATDDLDGVEDEAAAPEKVTKDSLRKNIVAYAKANGKTKAYALLEKFGAKNVDGLKEKDLEKVNTLVVKGLPK
jgi:hypothetical protein